MTVNNLLAVEKYDEAVLNSVSIRIQLYMNQNRFISEKNQRKINHIVWCMAKLGFKPHDPEQFLDAVLPLAKDIDGLWSIVMVCNDYVTKWKFQTKLVEVDGRIKHISKISDAAKNKFHQVTKIFF